MSRRESTVSRIDRKDRGYRARYGVVPNAVRQVTVQWCVRCASKTTDCKCQVRKPKYGMPTVGRTSTVIDYHSQYYTNTHAGNVKIRYASIGQREKTTSQNGICTLIGSDAAVKCTGGRNSASASWGNGPRPRSGKGPYSERYIKVRQGQNLLLSLQQRNRDLARHVQQPPVSGVDPGNEKAEPIR